MSTILDKIITQTKEDLSRRIKRISQSDFRSFAHYEQERISFSGALSAQQFGIIAEVKKASPSKGIIRENFDPVDIALRYEEGGASCISVLTDQPFFQGDLNYLKAVRDRVSLPLLRKDFIVNPYQVTEARAFGADAILLIAAVLSDAQLGELLHAADEEGLEALVECYDEAEVKRMPFDQLTLFGVNNRDLRTFETNIHRGIALLQQAPERVIRISESGLQTAQDLKLLIDSGIHAALIGESFMREPDPGKALHSMLQTLEILIQQQINE